MKISRYCTCGGALTGHVSPGRMAPELEIALAAAWSRTHGRPGCAPATPEQARAARRRADRARRCHHPDISIDHVD